MTERRFVNDRRRRPTPAFSRYWLRGRRSGGRRAAEVARIYVDRYRRGEVALITAILSASLVDLVLTWRHLAAGGHEANPLMAWFIESAGVFGFAVAKAALTVVGVTVLLVHVRFRGVAAMLRLAATAYALVLVWHVVAWLGRTA